MCKTDIVLLLWVMCAVILKWRELTAPSIYHYKKQKKLSKKRQRDSQWHFDFMTLTVMLKNEIVMVVWSTFIVVSSWLKRIAVQL